MDPASKHVMDRRKDERYVFCVSTVLPTSKLTHFPWRKYFIELVSGFYCCFFFKSNFKNENLNIMQFLISNFKILII